MPLSVSAWLAGLLPKGFGLVLPRAFPPFPTSFSFFPIFSFFVSFFFFF
jgi:hypothetical protein